MNTSTYTIERDATRTEKAFGVFYEGSPVYWCATPGEANAKVVELMSKAAPKVATQPEEVFLFTDTETTGFAKKGPYIQEGQARIVQLAMLLTDSQGKTLAEFSALIKPEGWVSSEGALKVHGKTHEMCERHGFNIKSVINLFSGFAARATHIVAHNEEFDHRMIDIEYAHVSGIDASQAYNATWVCTMKDRMVTKHFNGSWPKLAAALLHFTGRVLGDDAHDAMHDVKACRDIFFAARAAQEAA